MSEPGSRLQTKDKESTWDEKRTRPEPGNANLVLMYTLVALALIAALAVAIMVVWPFYQRR